MTRKKDFARTALATAAACLLAAPTAWADKSDEMRQWIDDNASERKYTHEEAMTMLPPGPNPYRSILPEGSSVNSSYWTSRRAAMSAVKSNGNPPANVRVQAKKGKGTVIRAFGTGPNQAPAIDVFGDVQLPPISTGTPNAEDEGSILLATPTGLTSGNAVKFSATIGDGPHGIAGTGLGDFDFYQIPNVQAGQVITVDIDTPIPFGALDPFVVLWDEAGNVIAFNDDDPSSFDSFLALFAPADGNYYVSVAGFGSFAPSNPFDSASGNGAGSEGIYDATISLDYVGEARLTFQMKKGDIFGASLTGDNLALLSLKDKTGLERQGSTQDATFIHPAASPLPSGNVALSHTVDTTGNFSLDVLVVGAGQFNIQLRAFTNPLKFGDRGDKQTIFVDFDGAAVDVGSICFGFPPGFFVPTLSPLSAYLGGWGLTAADEDAVIDSIMGHVHETLVADVDRMGREPTFDIELLNSRDHADPGSAPNVSRLVVGGSISETEIFPGFACATLGIAESIDVGNFETSETAFILLDLLSADASNPNSLNQYPRAPGVSIIEVIGAGVGNITSHEAGHFLGNWHTDQFNAQPNIQDQGGNLANTVGVGPDGIFGTADDFDVDFGRDVFVPSEGFTGIEDTLNTIAIGDPTPRGN